MKPHVQPRTLQASVPHDSASFGLSRNALDESHLMRILRDTLYTDKVLAVLREYSANAWDAHREVGKHHLPIDVHVPTSDDLTLRIRDYGPGLSADDVLRVYTQYGASTKRDSDDVVGMLGIGSKSAFAYADSFTVTSWHGGVKRVFVAVLDEADVGVMSLVHEEPYDDTSLTGVEVAIAVKPDDVHEFESTSRKLFRFFDPRPEINIELPAAPDEQTVLTNGAIWQGSQWRGSSWMAIMGCVPYRIDLNQLGDQVARCLHHLCGVVRFDVGAVDVSASREELKYSRSTKAALIVKFDALVDEYVTQALAALESGAMSAWDKRLRVQVLSKMELPLPEEYQSLGEVNVRIEHDGDLFTITRNKQATKHVAVAESTRLLVDDTGNELSGYCLTGDDYAVRSKAMSADELTVELTAALAASGLLGVKVQKLSELHWVAPYVKPKRKTNPKHKARMFTLVDPGGKFAKPWSDHWTVIDRIPEPTDVFVVIDGFQGHKYTEFYRDYRDDAAIASYLGLAMPVVYGYKTSEKKPVDPKACEGTEYRAWRETWANGLLTPDVVDKIQAAWWRRPWSAVADYDADVTKNVRAEIVKALGDHHAISQVLVKQATAPGGVGALERLTVRCGLKVEDSDARQATQAILSRYPLLQAVGAQVLWQKHYYDEERKEHREKREAWRDYVTMIDERLAQAVSHPTPILTLVPATAGEGQAS